MANLTGAQKAAVLLLHMGKERSAAVLRSMSESEVEHLMAEITRLDMVDANIVDVVMEEFHNLATARRFVAEGGVEFARGLLEESLGSAKAHQILDRLAVSITEAPFEFLRRADPRQILTYLQEEHPQTIALVLAHMAPDQAAMILSALPENMQSDIAHRIATMERTSPEVVRQVEQVLERKLSSVLQASESTQAAGGLQALVDLLTRSDRATEKLILTELEKRDAELAEQVRGQMFVFEDITTLDDRSIQLILRDVDVKELAVALKGVRGDVRDKILNNMSERAAANLAEEIDLLGPVRMKRVGEAQGSVVKVIRQLEESGQLVLSRGNEEMVL
jgi:flagellar motor switch protein FliG